jgi:hypothetical protein
MPKQKELIAPSLGEWLATNGLSEFEQVFADNQVDLTVLPLLTEAEGLVLLPADTFVT